MEFSVNLNNLTPNSYDVLVCPSCGKQFEVFTAVISNIYLGDKKHKCPKCGNDDVRQQNFGLDQ